MKTLNDVKMSCEIFGKHWIWTGAIRRSSNKHPVIWRPNYNANGAMQTLPAKRAVWYIVHKKALPERWRVISTCSESMCVSPHCISAVPVEQVFDRYRESGAWKGSPKRLLQVRRQGRSRTTMTPEKIQYIQSMTGIKSNMELAAELCVPEQKISKARNGGYACFQTIGVFSQLISVGDANA